MGLRGFTVQSLPLQGQLVLVVHAAQFASVAPLDPRPKVLKHLTAPASVVDTIMVVVDIVLSGVDSVTVEEAGIVDEASPVVVSTPAQSHA